MRSEYFFATGLSGEEFNSFLLEGWRRFGMFFFRPQCDICLECTPIRVRVNEFKLSKSLKRVIKKNHNTEVKLTDIYYSDEIYEIYKEHSLDRFNQKTNKKEFKESFFYSAVPSMMSNYYFDNELFAIGFIDVSNEAFSSVYFIYKTKYSHLSPGTFSAITEINISKCFGLKYYYLGYYIKNNHSMSYKSKFKCHDLYDWDNKKWIQKS